MKHAKGCIALILLLSLPGCGNITGLDAGNAFTCPIPNSKACQSVNAAYAGSGNRASDEKQGVSDDPVFSNPSFEVEGMSSIHKMRIPEKIVLLAIAPWTDSQGDLHEVEIQYLVVREPSWRSQTLRHLKKGNKAVTPLHLEMPTERNQDD